MLIAKIAQKFVGHFVKCEKDFAFGYKGDDGDVKYFAYLTEKHRMFFLNSKWRINSPFGIMKAVVKNISVNDSGLASFELVDLETGESHFTCDSGCFVSPIFR